MNRGYIYSVIIVMIIIILTVFGLIFIPNPKNFYQLEPDGFKLFPGYLKDIQKEVKDIKFDEHPVTELWKRKNHKLDIFVLYDMKKLMNHSINYPNLYKSLRTIPHLVSAKLIKVGKSTTMIKSTGWNNYVFECHFPIILKQDKKSGIWVNNEIKFYINKKELPYYDINKKELPYYDTDKKE
jgi:hypothetical protein